MDFPNITELLTQITSYINLVVGGNEFAAGAVIAGLMGIATYMGRTIPERIWRQFIKQITTTLELNNTNDSYYHLATYLHKKGYTDSTRYIKIGNGRYGDDKHGKQIGYGTQIFWFNWYTPILIDSSKADGDASSVVKEFINLKKLGRSHKLFDRMLEDIKEDGRDPTKTKFYSYDDDYQRFITSQLNKRMNTVILPKKILKKLYSTIDNFFKKEEWYLQHQVPYQLGILLYGPPGTGKTSLIKAIATYMKKDICFVQSEIALISAAIEVNDSIIVVEEIDTFCTDSRAGTDDKKDSDNKDLTAEKPVRGHYPAKPKAQGTSVEQPSPPPKRKLATKTSDSTLVDLIKDGKKHMLGKILNSLDGIISNHGRIIILTTNHKHVLDPALLRPGRIDLQIEVGYLTSETFNALIKRFFPDYEERPLNVKPEIAPVTIQNDIIMGLTPDELIENYTEDDIQIPSNFKILKGNE